MVKKVDRRDFIKTASAAVGIPAVLPGEGKKSRVVAVSAPGVVKEGNRPDAAALGRMVHQGIMKLTREDDLAAAWQCFVQPDDKVGIKINSWGGRLVSSKKGIIEAVVEGVRKAGVPLERIIVWEHLEDNLSRYMKRQKFKEEKGGIRFRACTSTLTRENYDDDVEPKGFDTEPVTFPWGKVKVSELVVNELTAIINIPVLKQHTWAGISACMKNISHAVVAKPWHCHENFCNPYIADIISIPCIKNKLRLHVLDGIFGIADGGPELKSMNHMFVHEKLLLSSPA
jgi:uncharacterized protein (DUF362 family)